MSEEEGNQLAKIKWISNHLDVTPPSVVQFLRKMDKQGYVKYKEQEGIKLTDKGRNIARDIIRNHRLIETLMVKTLDQKIDENIACGMEHHMTREFANALCTELKHPTKCPHGNKIPKGDCCPD